MTLANILMLATALLFSKCQAPPVADTVEIDGTQFLAQQIPLEGTAVAAGYFNKDRYPDLVGAGAPQLSIFLGDGDGGLVRTSRVAGGEHPVDYAVTDLDADGDTDIVVANHETDYVTLLLGDGRGTFHPATHSPLRIAVRPHPHAVHAADLNADGHVDLVVDHREAEGMLTLRGRSEGRFDSTGQVVNVGGDPYRGMALGDLNEDGQLDLVTPNPSKVGVFLNTSSDQIAFTDAASVPAAAPFAVALGDLNGDDRLDLIAASDEGSPLVELFFGDGEGGFEEAPDSPVQFAPGAKKIAIGDFNGDGTADAAVSSYDSSDVLVLLGGPESIRTDFLPSGEHPWGMAVADFNADGKDDLVIADDATRRATVYLSLGK